MRQHCKHSQNCTIRPINFGCTNVKKSCYESPVQEQEKRLNEAIPEKVLLRNVLKELGILKGELDEANDVINKLKHDYNMIMQLSSKERKDTKFKTLDEQIKKLNRENEELMLQKLKYERLYNELFIKTKILL